MFQTFLETVKKGKIEKRIEDHFVFLQINY